MAGEVGALNRLLIDTATPGVGSFWAEFISETVTQNIEIINSAGIRGTRTQASERNRRGNEVVTGTIEFECSRLLLDNILPGALGAAESSNVFDVSETLPDLYFLIDKGSDIVLISEARISVMRITGNQSEIVKVSIDIEAESATWGQSWPSGPAPDTSNPYFFSDLADVEIESTAREVFTFEVTVDNGLIVDQFANNLTRDERLNASDRIVGVTITVPNTTANSDLVDVSATEGAAVSFVLTNADEASSVLTIALGPTAFNSATPTTPGKGQTTIPLVGTARGLGHAGATTPDIKITNAHA